MTVVRRLAVMALAPLVVLTGGCGDGQATVATTTSSSAPPPTTTSTSITRPSTTVTVSTPAAGPTTTTGNPAPGGTTVLCKDGTLASAGPTACSAHGGPAQLVPG